LGGGGKSPKNFPTTDIARFEGRKGERRKGEKEKRRKGERRKEKGMTCGGGHMTERGL